MRYPIKLLIQQMKPTKGDWMRYYTVDRILIDNDTSIKTEAQLCYYIYKRFGTGRFMCLGYQRGYAGFWNFWNGDIYPNGFIRSLSKNKEINKLQKDFVKAGTYEEKQDIEEEIQFERELSNEEKKLRRKGPTNLIRSKPGQLNEYQEF